MSTEQELGHKIWTIVERFYRSHVFFTEQFENYEKRVLNYSRLTGIHRDDLRLNSAELASLLDLKSLERLRDGYIQELKDLCHLVFRGHDRTDLLDRYVSDIFHEISILKEEHYNVKTYAPLYERDAAEVELRHILDEAHKIFPEKLNHIRYLFGRARARLEELLPSFGGLQVLIRSLYFHRRNFVKDAYPEGIDRFYWFMYPLGSLEGYYTVGVSYLHAGFYDEAREAFRLGEEAYRRRLTGEERGPVTTRPIRSGAAGSRSGGGGAGRPASAAWRLEERSKAYEILLSLRCKLRRIERQSKESGRPRTAAVVEAGTARSDAAP